MTESLERPSVNYMALDLCKPDSIVNVILDGEVEFKWERKAGHDG